MPARNSEVAKTLHRIADLLEIDNANPFRIRAYRNAAHTVEELPHELSDMLKAGKDLTELPGIGKDLAAKIAEIVRTHFSPFLEELEKSIPGALIELTRLSGLGPKRIMVLHQKLGVDSIATLEKAAQKGLIRQLPGFGEKTEEKILTVITQHKSATFRTKLETAESTAMALTEFLKEIPKVKKVVIAGSYRRRKDTVGDLDILVTCKDDKQVIEHFVQYKGVAEVIQKGTTRSTVRLHSGLQVDLRVVPQESYGAALHYFTGSKAHNIAIRRLGLSKNLKINEYGIFRGEERLAGRKEEEVFAQVGLPYIEPELREDRGEIQAAQQGKLPCLITMVDIRGDLNCHIHASDNHNSLTEIAEAAKKIGYEYLAISKYSRRLGIGHDLDKKRLSKELEEIDRLNEQLQGFRILKSAEVDILEDGSLDLDESILKKLDLRVCSIHSQMGLEREKQTERVLRAMDNPYFHILGHPTGRLVNQRESLELDIERVLEEAKKKACFIELNARAHRLDLIDRYCRLAKEIGVKVGLSSDAQKYSDLACMRLGLDQARRGWLERADVLNTLRWNSLRKQLNRH